MNRILMLLLCLFLIAGILAACNTTTPQDQQDPSQSESQTQSEPAVKPEDALPPEQVIQGLDANAVVMEIGTHTKQVWLPDHDLTAIREVFASAGYASVQATLIEHAIMQTEIMYGKDVTVTLQSTGNGAYAVWEPYSESALSLLVPNEGTGTGEVTLAQLGIARTEETDNPMNGMCYIYKLSDGSAVIIDGGFNTKACRENIMNTLKALDIVKNAQGEYRITAWILTHGHKDHRAAFTGVGNNYADKIELSYVLYNFPVSPGPLTTSTFDLLNFEEKLANNYPEAQHVIAHAGLSYHFGNLTVQVLYSPEMLYAPDTTIGYYNDTSLIFIADCAGARTLYMGDAGEIAAETVFAAYEPTAFDADMLQITHHGFNTGTDSHRSRYIKQLYNSTNASFGLLPMGSQFEGEERNGRYTVIVGHGNANYQMALVVNKRDKHEQNSISQEYYEQFVADVATGTSKYDTLFGYDGINKIDNGKGMITYTAGNESEPMITLFALSESGVSVADNRTLAAWLN